MTVVKAERGRNGEWAWSTAIGNAGRPDHYRVQACDGPQHEQTASSASATGIHHQLLMTRTVRNIIIVLSGSFFAVIGFRHEAKSRSERHFRWGHFCQGRPIWNPETICSLASSQPPLCVSWAGSVVIQMGIHHIYSGIKFWQSSRTYCHIDGC